MEKTYQDYIYENYSDSLQNNMIMGKLENEQKAIFRYFKKNYLPYFPVDKNASVLDLGCGFANYLIAAKKCGYNNIMGVDSSTSVVDFCKKKKIFCIQADAKEFLKDKKNNFDVIIFNDVIEHLKKEELFDMLILLKESLKSNGIIFIKTMNLSNPITGATGRYFDLTHELGFNEVSLRQVLKASKFKNIKIIGADIYINYFPFIYFLKLFAKLNNGIWYMLNCLYGRTSIKIFEKNLIAIARKE